MNNGNRFSRNPVIVKSGAGPVRGIEGFLQRFLEASLAEAVDGALGLCDDLADEIYDLEERLRRRQTLGEFVDRCRSRGLSVTALEDKLAARAGVYADAAKGDRP